MKIKRITKLTDIQKLEYEFYSKHREYLRTEKHSMENKYAQLLVYLNSGIFTVSAILVNMYQIIFYKFFIIISWLCAGTSLIFILLSFLFSIKSFKEALIKWDKYRKEVNFSWYVIFMKFCTWLSIVLLMFAIFFLFLFFSLNLLTMNNQNPKTFVESQPVGVQKSSEPTSSWTSPTEFFATPPAQDK